MAKTRTLSSKAQTANCYRETLPWISQAGVSKTALQTGYYARHRRIRLGFNEQMKPFYYLEKNYKN